MPPETRLISLYCLYSLAKVRSTSCLSHARALHCTAKVSGLCQNLILKTVIENPWALRDNYWVVPCCFRALLVDSNLFLSVIRSIRHHPGLVFEIFQWAVARKGSDMPSEFVICSVLEVLLQNGLLRPAYWVAERVVNADNMPTIFNALVDGYLDYNVALKILDLTLWILADKLDVGMCLWLFEKMVKNGFSPDVESCNRILLILKRDRDLTGKEAVELYELMCSFGIKPTITTYNIMLDLFCKLGEMLKAFDFFLKMLSRGCPPTDVSYNVMINGLARNGYFDEAKKLVADMVNKGMKVSVYAYTSLVSEYAHQRMLVKALGVWEEMIMRGVTPDVCAYNALMLGYCKQGRVDYAMQWVAIMLKKNLVLDIISYSTLIYGYCLLGDMKGALFLLSDLRKRNLRPNTVTYNTIIDRIAKQGNLEGARQIKDYMIGLGISPDIYTYTILINCSYHTGNLSMAKEFYSEMLHKGLKPDHFVYNTCIVGELKLNTYGVLRLQEEMVMQRSLDDVTTYTVFVDGISKLSDLGEACQLLRMMIRDGIKPNHVTFTSIIHAHLEIGHLEKAREFFFEMLRLGLSPTVVTYTVLIQGHASKGKLELAFMYFSRMLNDDILPDVTTYNVLIDGLCKVRRMDEAYMLFHEMRHTGISPNKYTYSIMINGNCDLGNWQDAWRLYRDMLDRGIQPDTCTHSAMLKHLREDYKPLVVQELEFIIQHDKEIAQLVNLRISAYQGIVHQDAPLCIEVLYCLKIVGAIAIVALLSDSSERIWWHLSFLLDGLVSDVNNVSGSNVNPKPYKFFVHISVIEYLYILGLLHATWDMIELHQRDLRILACTLTDPCGQCPGEGTQKHPRSGNTQTEGVAVIHHSSIHFWSELGKSVPLRFPAVFPIGALP